MYSEIREWQSFKYHVEILEIRGESSGEFANSGMNPVKTTVRFCQVEWTPFKVRPSDGSEVSGMLCLVVKQQTSISITLVQGKP
jgi:hypothetical protein